jgi:hypothetical protein
MKRAVIALSLTIVAVCVNSKPLHGPPCLSLMAREYFCTGLWCHDRRKHAVIKKTSAIEWEFIDEEGFTTTARFRDAENMTVFASPGWLELTARPHLCQFPARIEFFYGVAQHWLSTWVEVPGQSRETSSK